MPTSFLDLVPYVVQWIKDKDPKSVLDVGAGYGKYGHLIREYVDVYPWSIYLEAVEGFDAYSDRMGCNAYDFYNHTTFEKYKPSRMFDMLLMIDIIEHYEKPQGHQALAKALSMSDVILVSTPSHPAEQGAEYGNELERHKSQWTHDDFSQSGTWTPLFQGHAVVGYLTK